MRSNRWSGAAAIVLAAALFAGLAGTPSAVFAGGPPEVGQAAPGLVVQRLDGQPFDLSSLHGKVVIVNFWATWCAPCRAEMPALEAFYRKYHDQGLELLGLSIDDPHDRGEVDEVMRKFSYPAALMNGAKVNGFGMPLAVPMTYVIDSAGVVRARLIAGKTAVTERSLAQTVAPLLSKKAAASSR